MTPLLPCRHSYCSCPFSIKKNIINPSLSQPGRIYRLPACPGTTAMTLEQKAIWIK